MSIEPFAREPSSYLGRMNGDPIRVSSGLPCPPGRRPGRSYNANGPHFGQRSTAFFGPREGDLTEELPLLFGEVESREPAGHRGRRPWRRPGSRRRARGGRPWSWSGRSPSPSSRRCSWPRRSAASGWGPGSCSTRWRGPAPEADLVLASGDRDLYRRQGFEPVPPLARFCLPPAATLAGALGEYGDAGNRRRRARAPRPRTWLDLQTLTEAEPVHFVRSDDDWRAAARARGRLVDAPATFTLVDAAVARRWPSSRRRRRCPGPTAPSRPRRILEVAGDRAAVVSVAPLLAEELLVPAYDSATIDRAIGARLGAHDPSVSDHRRSAHAGGPRRSLVRAQLPVKKKVRPRP